MNQESPTNSGASKSKKRFSWAWIILVLVAVLSVPVFFIGFFITLPSRTLHNADAGFKKAKETINPEQLRAWALEEIPKYPITNEDMLFPKMPNSEIPSYMQKLYAERPEDARVEKYGDQTHVAIYWGGPFFHWWFEVGSTNFVPLTNSRVTRVQWVPGIYYNLD